MSCYFPESASTGHMGVRYSSFYYQLLPFKPCQGSSHAYWAWGGKSHAQHVYSIPRVSDKEHPEDGATPPSRLECIGLATGCFVLARCLQLGNGIAKDEAKAMTYYNKVP